MNITWQKAALAFIIFGFALLPPYVGMPLLAFAVVFHDHDLFRVTKRIEKLEGNNE